MHMDDLRLFTELDRRAVDATETLVRRWDVGVDPQTPCVGWKLSDLVAHMTVQHLGFARAASGEHTQPADWTPEKRADPIAAYSAACATVRDAFARLTDPAAPVLLPEVRPRPLPAGTIVGFHLVDNVVHAWDVAQALGADVRFGADVLRAALAVAQEVPDDERRERPGAAFARARPVPEDAAVFDRILLLLGRDPAWRTAVAAG
jgi:uncharacterized protein (TIGR03086 family)